MQARDGIGNVAYLGAGNRAKCIRRRVCCPFYMKHISFDAMVLSLSYTIVLRLLTFVLKPTGLRDDKPLVEAAEANTR